MVTPLVGQVVLAVYAVLLAAGGLMGYLKAGSRPSLIAGLAFGLAAGAGAVLARQNPAGFVLGAAVAGLLAVFFGRRYFRLRKFMPAGMLTILSVAVLVLMVLELTAGRPNAG